MDFYKFPQIVNYILLCNIIVRANVLFASIPHMVGTLSSVFYRITPRATLTQQSSGL